MKRFRIHLLISSCEIPNARLYLLVSFLAVTTIMGSATGVYVPGAKVQVCMPNIEAYSKCQPYSTLEYAKSLVCSHVTRSCVPHISGLLGDSCQYEKYFIATVQLASVSCESCLA